jgi:serine/threonine protein kinase
LAWEFGSWIIDVIQQLPQPIEFGKYTLFERLGRGGMADVYKGRIKGPAGFERIFVVKRILPHLSDDPAFIRMFVNEAKLSARLNHPNIVQIFELGSVEGEYFIAMEYVHGQDLSATIRALWKSATPPVPALVSYVGREVCMALAYAHRLTDEHGRPLGMIHRDVSPSNVMLSYDGAVKLLDFGIAKVMGDAPEGNRGHDGGAGGGGGGGGGGNKRGEEEAGRAHGALYAERVTPRQPPPRHHRTGPLPRSATDR